MAVALLAGAVEVLLAGDELSIADDAAIQLSAISESFGCAGLRASAAYCPALVALAADDPQRALPHARTAAQLWGELRPPYEVARAKVLIGRAVRLLGDEASAAAELTAACRAFAELGAIRPGRRSSG